MKNNQFENVKKVLQKKFGWRGINQLTPMQEELINDVIRSIDIEPILKGFELYYSEEYGQNITSGAIDEYIKHINKE